MDMRTDIEKRVDEAAMAFLKEFADLMKQVPAIKAALAEEAANKPKKRSWRNFGTWV